MGRAKATSSALFYWTTTAPAHEKGRQNGSLSIRPLPLDQAKAGCGARRDMPNVLPKRAALTGFTNSALSKPFWHDATVASIAPAPGRRSRTNAPFFRGRDSLASKPNSEMLDTRMSHPWKLKISDFRRDPSQGAAPIPDGVCNASLPAIRIYDPYPTVSKRRAPAHRPLLRLT